MNQSITVESLSLPGQRTDDDSSVFPLVLLNHSESCSIGDTREWIQSHRDSLVNDASLHGAVLFRGFPVHSDADLDQFIRAFDLPNFRYEDSLSNAVRTNRTDRVFTANEAPSDVNICLHHEMAQTPIYPSMLFFFCEQAAESGGATPLCRSDVLFARMRRELPEFASDCESLGLKYSHTMPGDDDPRSGMGRSWRSTWTADTPYDAEQTMTGLGYTWEWLPNECLKVTTPVLQAVRVLADGRRTFFNQLIAAFHGWKDSRNDPAGSITFGDGRALDPATISTVIEMAEEITFDLPWQTTDVALVDNYVAMHGRRPFEGTRKVLASLVASEL